MRVEIKPDLGEFVTALLKAKKPLTKKEKKKITTILWGSAFKNSITEIDQEHTQSLQGLYSFPKKLFEKLKAKKPLTKKDKKKIIIILKKALKNSIIEFNLEHTKSIKGEIINLQKLYSVPSKVFEKFWKSKFDRILLKSWKNIGIHATVNFVGEFPILLGKKKYAKFLDYAEKNLTFNEFYNKQNEEFNYNDIQRYAIRRLQEKYGIDTEKDRPQIIKQCLICKKIFNAVNENFSSSIKSINLKVCGSCFGKIYAERYSKKSKLQMIKYLKKLSEVLGGSIPPSRFISIVHQINEKNQVDLIKILKIIPSPEMYKQKFGSYFKALIAAGLLEKGARITARGIQCLAKDGHECLSLSEKKIDDWLYKHGIKHIKEPEYPLNKNLNPNGLLRADWKVNKYYIEFFGLNGQIDYDRKIFLKKNLACDLNLKLIEIYNEDLKFLDIKLKKFKKVKNLEQK